MYGDILKAIDLETHAQERAVVVERLERDDLAGGSDPRCCHERVVANICADVDHDHPRPEQRPHNCGNMRLVASLKGDPRTDGPIVEPDVHPEVRQLE